MNIKQYVGSKEYRQICVLKFLREFAKIPAKEIAQSLGMSTANLSLIESGKREATQRSISEMSNALEAKLGLSNDLEKLVGTCSEDSELLKLIEDYNSSEKGGFSTVFNIAEKIAYAASSLS